MSKVIFPELWGHEDTDESHGNHVVKIVVADSAKQDMVVETASDIRWQKAILDKLVGCSYLKYPLISSCFCRSHDKAAWAKPRRGRNDSVAVMLGSAFRPVYDQPPSKRRLLETAG